MEPESWAVDTEDTAFTQTLKLLGQLDYIGPQQSRERLRGERLLQRGSGEQHAVGRGPLRSALGQ
jgi:hypothetical protein